MNKIFEIFLDCGALKNYEEISHPYVDDPAHPPQLSSACLLKIFLLKLSQFTRCRMLIDTR
jgi:hypothetical protein